MSLGEQGKIGKRPLKRRLFPPCEVTRNLNNGMRERRATRRSEHPRRK